MIYPVIMAGGRGERFWPYSNGKSPKQLLPLVSKRSMLEDMLHLIQKIDENCLIHIIANTKLVPPIKKIIGKNPNIVIIGEPVARNTAPAIALAAKLIMEHDPKGIMTVLTADHFIRPPKEFIRAIKAGAEIAREGESLVTFGIRPSRPDTGYGYIETKAQLPKVRGLECRSVKMFHEKPDNKVAQKYYRSKRFFWNSGMFAWRVDYLWSIFRVYMPDVHRAFESAGSFGVRPATLAKKLKMVYHQIKGESIDYGIMEKAPSISVVIPNYEWDDIGAWAALDRLNKADKAGNRILGKAVMQDSKNTSCFSTAGLVAAFGVEDLQIVNHNGVVLVMKKEKGADLKQLLKKVKDMPENDKYL